MSHPLKSEASNAHTAKMRSMTKNYGLASGPANNIASPQDRLKGEAGEKNVGFGADSDAASPKRGDRAARTSASANPIATYARGGKVKHKADGGMAVLPDKSGDKMTADTSSNAKGTPWEGKTARKHGGRLKHRDQGGDVSTIEEANRDQAATSSKASGGVIARARGGRAGHKKGSTHVNVIVAPQGGGAGGPPPGGVPPQLAALMGGAKPPMAPPMAPPGGMPPGAPPMMPPGAGGPPGMPPGMHPPMAPPPGMPMRARGGKVMGGHPNPDSGAAERTRKEEGLIAKAKGGRLHMTAGAVTGEGRLEKMGITARHRGSMKPQEV